MAINKQEAERVAEQHLRALSEKLNADDDEGDAPVVLVLVRELTIAKPYGWVFFYDSEDHLRGIPGSGLGGNAPFLVARQGGGIQTLASNVSVKKQLAVHEEAIKRAPRS